MNSILELLSQRTLIELLEILIDAEYFQYFLPFLLLFTLYFHVLQKVLGKKGSKLLTKSASVVISLIVSFYSIAFTFPSGYSIADLMIFLFPNISSITIAILCLYVISAVLGYDFFRGLFRKDVSAYGVFFFAGVALGSVIYYGGIVIGLWSFDPYSSTDWISVVLVVGALIGGVVFFILGWIPLALVLLYISISFIYNMGSTSLFDLIFDPFLFILFIFIGLVNWLFKDESQASEYELTEQSYQRAQNTLREIEKNYRGRPPQRGQDLLYDINSQNLEGYRKKLGR